MQFPELVSSFQRGCFPGAVHAPPGSLLTEDGQLVPGPAADAVRAAKGRLMCVVGGRNATAVKQVWVCLRVVLDPEAGVESYCVQCTDAV